MNALLLSAMPFACAFIIWAAAPANRPLLPADAWLPVRPLKGMPPACGIIMPPLAGSISPKFISKMLFELGKPACSTLAATLW